jgi:hypothetical protein
MVLDLVRDLASVHRILELAAQSGARALATDLHSARATRLGGLRSADPVNQRPYWLYVLIGLAVVLVLLLVFAAGGPLALYGN